MSAVNLQIPNSSFTERSSTTTRVFSDSRERYSLASLPSRLQELSSSIANRRGVDLIDALATVGQAWALVYVSGLAVRAVGITTPASIALAAVLGPIAVESIRGIHEN